MKRFLKILGIIILLMAMGYASNWDLPKEDAGDLDQAIAEYKAKKSLTIMIDGEEYEGMEINGLYYEPLELWQGSLPESVLESEGN